MFILQDPYPQGQTKLSVTAIDRLVFGLQKCIHKSNFNNVVDIVVFII